MTKHTKWPVPEWMLSAPLWGKKTVGMGIRRVPMKTALMQTCQLGEKSLFLSLKYNLPHNSNSPSKAPMSLSEQRIDPLWVFLMGTELHRQREEVGKAYYGYGSPHAKDLATQLPSRWSAFLPCSPTQFSSVLPDKHKTQAAPHRTPVRDDMCQPFGSKILNGRYTEVDLPTLNCIN